MYKLVQGRFRKNFPVNTRPLNVNVKNLLVLYHDKTARLIIKFIFIFVLATFFLLSVPFYPLYMALLFGVSIAAIGVRYPKGAIVLAILLSVSAVIYQENVENPLLIACLFAYIFPLSATKTRWIDGALVLLAVALAFTPELNFLAFIPVIIAGILLFPRDGAMVGLCAASLILLFLIIGMPSNINHAGLICISEGSATKSTLGKGAIQNFQPITLFEQFKNYVTGDTISHWTKAFIYAGNMLEKFLYDINLWILPALWCVSGYIASKSTQWYSKITKYPYLMASVTAIILPIIGYATATNTLNSYLIFGAIATSVLIGIIATPINFQIQITKLQNKKSEIEAKLEETGANIAKMADLGYNTKTISTRLNELKSNLSSEKMNDLLQRKEFYKASALFNSIMGESTKLEEESDNQLNKITQIEDRIRVVESNIDEIKSTIRKTEKILYQVTMMEEKEELEEIQKGLTDVKNMAKKGLFENALDNLEKLKNKSEALNAEVLEIYEFWSKMPQWSKAVEEKLATEGKADIRAISEIPEKWRSQAANYFLKEKEDQELTFKNGIIYSTEAAQPPTTKKEARLITVKTRVTKPISTEEIDGKVFRYIQDHQGTISVKKALEALSLSEKEFQASIKRLKEKRLIE
ncbi:MAG: hypothetical protein ACPLYF_02910 [Fervidobacterium sp.]